jgi:hypothetical protein
MLPIARKCGIEMSFGGFLFLKQLLLRFFFG